MTTPAGTSFRTMPDGSYVRGYDFVHEGTPCWQTSIGGMSKVLDRPAINGWMMNRAIDLMAVEGQELDGMPVADRRRYVKAKLKDDTAAADRGTRIHAICEALLTSGEVLDDPDAGWVTEQLQEFLADHDVEIIASERTMAWIEDGKVLAVGTSDAIFRIYGKVVLIDFKSGKRIYADSALTTCGYAFGTHYVIDGETVPIPEDELVEQVAILHMKEGGLDTYHVADFRAFEPIYRALFVLNAWTHDGSRNVWK